VITRVKPAALDVVGKRLDNLAFLFGSDFLLALLPRRHEHPLNAPVAILPLKLKYEAGHSDRTQTGQALQRER
jgi:hypothetical protein